jgi:hypothetical protein
VRLVNGSTIHFVGLDNPQRWFSAEIGELYFDEAHEIPEDKVLMLATRLRQRCQECSQAGREACSHLPHRMSFAFNPDSPAHWLYRWFLAGAKEIKDAQGRVIGYRKDYLTAGEAAASLGDCVFILARAVDNPFLPPEYVQKTLLALPPLLRQRYLEGRWVYAAGRSFFDLEGLQRLEREARDPVIIGVMEEVEGRARISRKQGGGWWVWKPPVRAGMKRKDGGAVERSHSYVVACDVSSGTSNDYSAVVVMDVDELEVVAEFQGMIEPSRLAEQCYLAARLYCNAVIAPEITGGWGYAIVQELRRLGYGNVYTRVQFDRLSARWTDAVGWDTNERSRAIMLDNLERAVRMGGVKLPSTRLLHELATFTWPSKGIPRSPRAAEGANDDLVMATAIALTVALERRPARSLRQSEYTLAYTLS